MYFLVDLVRETVVVFVRTAPFLLFGFFFAGVLKVLIPTRWLAATLGKRDFRSVLLASLVGVPLPLCSCSVLPTAVTMRRSGASKGATVSFLVSTPETGVDSISVTYALMDPIMTVARPLAAFGTAMAAGVAVNVATRREEEQPAADPPGPGGPPGDPGAAGPADGAAGGAPETGSCHDETDSCCACGSAEAPQGASRNGRLREIFAYGYGELLDSIAPWFVIGILLTGLISAIIPAGALDNPTLRGLPSMLIMLVIGIPLYVCATSSTPIAAALILKGLSPGAALVFLLAGPATNAASLTILLKLLGKRVIAVYLAAIVVISLLAGALVNAVYVSSGIDAAAVAGKAGMFIPAWLEAVAAVFFLGLLISSARRIGMLRRWREDLRGMRGRLGVNLGGRGALRVYVVILLVLYLLTCFGSIGPGEVGWVVSFGKVTRTISESGLVIHWPYPFALLEKERPDLVRMIDRGYRTEEGTAFSYDRVVSSASERELTKEAEVATGDENLLAIRYSVQYQVSDAYTYHFGIADADRLVTAFAEYALRRVMCHHETDSILVNHRRQLEQRVATRLRNELDALGVGVSILRVDLVDVHAPPEVHFAFRDVASAMEDKHRFTHQAESYRARLIASARGQAYTTTIRAGGRKLLQIAEASGRAYGFTALEAACRGSRALTQLRYYLDAAGRLLPRARVILPLVDLPLDLWVNRGPRTQSWPDPFGGSSGGAGGSGGPGGPGATTPGQSGLETDASATAPGGTAQSGETWREKLARLQERDR